MNLEEILNGIRPDEREIKTLSGIVASLGNVLKNGSNYLKIKKVTPAGSLGKKTLLKGHLEADCVYILERNGYPFGIYANEVQRCLRDNLPDGTKLEKGRHAISFTVQKKIGEVAVDVIPAFEVNSPLQMKEVKNYEAYYGSTSIWHKKYIKKQVQVYPRFIDLVLLMKEWRNANDIPLSSFQIELLTAFSVNNTMQDEEFPFFFEVCFRTIQGFCDQKPIIPVNWEHWYSSNDINAQEARNTELLIVDPADPSENIAEKITADELSYIKSEASKAAGYAKKGQYERLMNI